MKGLRTVCAVCVLIAANAPASQVRLVHTPRQTDPDGSGKPRVVVDDPDAQHGTAQAAVPGKSQPGGPVCSFYSYARPAGVYRVTWRVKVNDNTIDKPVFVASTGGGKRNEGGSITLKGTDFQKPNVYQDFSYTASKGEGGFFGVSATWPGQGEVHVDTVTVVSERLSTDRELAGNLQLPDEWFFPRPPPLSIHIAKGLWWDFFGLRDLAPEMGGGLVTSSYQTSGQQGRGLRGFPGSWQGMAANNLIVLANIDGPSLGSRGRALVEEYVRNGGALLVLGGPFTFDGGGYEHTSIENVLPCKLTGKQQQHARDGLVLKPADGADAILDKDLSWQVGPRIYRYHEVMPADGATVLAQADGKPILMVARVGKGRVAAFTAGVEGDPAPDQMAFWEWGDTPRLIASVCRWLVADPPVAAARGMDPRSKALLEKLSVPAPSDEDDERQRLLAALLSKCRDKVFAREIVTAVAAQTGSPDRPFVAAVAGSIRPFADESLVGIANELIDTRDPGKADLGIRTLGMCKPTGVAPRMKRFLFEGVASLSEDVERDGLDLDGMMMGAGADAGADNRIKLAAIIAIGDMGDVSFMPALRNLTPQFADKRQTLLEITETSNLNEDIYQQSLAARCRLGDGTAVAPLLDAILLNESYIEEFRNALSRALVYEHDKALIHRRKVAGARLPVLYARRESLMTSMRDFPYSIAGDMTRELARLGNEVLAPYAYAALTPHTQRQLSREAVLAVIPLMEACDVPEMRLLAFKLASGADKDVLESLYAAAASLAKAADPATARFAVRLAPRLPPRHRANVLAEGLKHQSDDVKRIARLHLPLIPDADRKALE